MSNASAPMPQRRSLPREDLGGARKLNASLNGGYRAMGEHNRHKKNEAESVNKKAYELWEKDGRKEGCDLNYWLDAERVLSVDSKK